MKNVLSSFKRVILALCLVMISVTSIFANDYVKFKGWKQAETTHFRFIYEAASEEAAKKYAEFADEAWEKIARIYAMPQEKTNVYVFSRLNVVNAYTFFTPPEIVMFDAPVIDSYFGFRDDWMKLFFTHELIHIANINFEDKSYLTSKLFGEAFRGLDYSMIPGWALEGLTTVLETELTNGGRGRSPYFELSLKAPTVENNFIPYRLIGTEQEPPSSQIYVMGYLIMRSIADRWGIQALADIERNRTNGKTWEDSVYLVTGETAPEIYRKAKIALEKKYAKEREIPEGKTISTTENNIYYSRPAVIMDDGSIIINKNSISGESITVLLNPGEKDGIQYYEDITNAKDDDKNILKETILFKGADYITADEQMNVYANMPISRYDRKPNNETQYQVYKWTKENGLVRLTHDESSYFQVSVSRDGKLLVAVEQQGLKMRLVKIDTESGEKNVLFQDEHYSFIQPAVNEDGSKVAFVIVKDDRSCIALGDTASGTYKIVNNTEYDFITDPSYPGFNKDGSLCFSSNDRGRLEIYEATQNSDGQTFTCVPVLADPVGVLCAYKNDMGIYYVTQSSTGRVLKIKPLEEWGKVPDFEGPSPAGQIMTFGELTDDYPDFNPYKKQEISKDENSSESTSENDSQDEDPVKHRSEEKIAQLENLEPATKELTNEKRFRPFISPLFYMPFVDMLQDPKNAYFGIGGFFWGSLPRYQMQQGILAIDAFYYPQVKNFTGEIISEIILPSGFLDIFISRNASNFELNKDTNTFSLQNTAVAGYTLPLISRDDYFNSKELDYLAYAGISFTQNNDKAFAINENIPYSKQLNFQTGIAYDQKNYLKKDDSLLFSITNLALGEWDFSKKKMFVGYEGEFSINANMANMIQELGLVIRYTDFPVASTVTMSRAHFNGKTESNLYPGKILLNYTYCMPGLLFGMGDANFIVQGLASFGKNTADGGTPETGNPLNFNLEKKVNIGAEMSFDFGLSKKLTAGFAGLFDLSKSNPSTEWNFYISAKINWLRF